MQRPNGEGSQPPAVPSANYDPRTAASQALAPGQVFAPNSVARAWPTLPELANALKRRMVLAIFLGLLVGTAAAAAVWLALPNGKHDVRAMLEVTPNAGNVTGGISESNFDTFKQKQTQLIKTRLLLEQVKSNPAVAKLPDIVNSDDQIRFLEENIRVSWDADLMRVTMKGDEPKQLQTILDTLLVEFIKDAEGAESRNRARMRVRLEADIDTANKDIEMRNKQLRRVVDQDSATDPLLNAVLLEGTQNRLGEYIKEHARLKAALPPKVAALKELTEQLKTIDATPIDPEALDAAIAGDPQFTEAAQNIKRLETRLEITLDTAPPTSDRIQRDRDDLNRARAELRERTQSQRPRFEKLAREKARSKLAAQKAAKAAEIKDDTEQLQTFETLEKSAREEVSRISRNNLNVTLTKADLEPLTARRDKMAMALSDLELQSRNEARITIREKAYIVLNQNLKQKVLLSIAAFLAGTGALMLAVAFLEWRSRRVDSVDQVVTELGLRVIGTIPAFPSKQALKSGDAATSQNWRFVLNESVNSARTMLLHTAKTQNMQVLMVTSAMQGEGKTSLASQLATSMATAGLRTLILDCDLRNPSMHKLFDAPLTPGCSEVLCQEVDVSDAVQPTAVPNLWLIPAGQCSNRVVSALAQGHPLETLFNRLRGQFDFIVVDSCPVLPVADSLLVGQYVDGVLLSILQDISQLPKVQQVSDRLTDLNIPLLGAVVNGVKPDIHAYGYNYVKQLPA